MVVPFGAGSRCCAGSGCGFRRTLAERRAGLARRRVVAVGLLVVGGVAGVG